MSKTNGWRNRIMRMLLAGMATVALAAPASAQLNESCTVSALNRTAPVQPNGSWVLPNVPSNQGPVRVRATCVENGITRSGQSELTTIVANGVIQVPEISFADPEPIPASLNLAAATDTLTSTGQTLQLATTVTYADGSTADLTAGSTGTDYRSSNPAIAAVDDNGRVTAGVSGVVLISAVNEGALGVLQLQVVTSGDSDGDGLPDDYEVEIGLNPNNPVDALDDQDQDDLATIDEYRAGLNPRNADTDGDRLRDGEEGTYGTNPLLFDTDADQISDGLEVLAGSNPLDLNSVNLGPIIESLTVRPASFTLIFNTAVGEASQRLDVRAKLIDGTELNARLRRYGTNYSSSNLAIVSFGAEDGVVFAGQDGTAIVSVSIGTVSATVEVHVETFAPTALSFLSLPGFANGVDVAGDYAYVAAGSAGLHVVDVSDPGAPVRVATVNTPGNANDVRVESGYAYVADGPSGLQIVDVNSPVAPALAGGIDTPGTATDVAVLNGRAYVADGSAGLRVIDVSVPTAPLALGAVDTPGNARGVDAVDDFVVVADAQGGVHIVSVANPASPVILGSTHTRPNSVSRAADVAVRDRLAFVADGSDSSLGGLRVIDFRNPSTPVVVGSTSNQFGLVGVALEDSFAVTADYYFANAVPIFDVGAAPLFTAVLDFSQAPSFRDDNGNGVAVSNGIVYLVGARWTIQDNDTVGDSGLHIGRYVLLGDELGVAPTVSITAPAAGSSAPERSALTVQAAALDDVRVESVRFLIDGAQVARDYKAPFEATVTVPAGVASFTLGAVATDLGGNQGTAEEVEVAVVPDTKPAVALLAPVAGLRIVEGTSISIAAEASDDVGVSAVEFFINGVSRSRLTSPPYRFNFTVPVNTTQLTISAVATDTVAQTTSTGDLVFPVEDDPAPFVTLVAPLDGQEVVEGSRLRVLAGATDDNAVQRVRFLANNLLVSEDLTEPYEAEVTVPAAGSELLVSAVAFDNLNQQSRADVRVVATPDPGMTVEGAVAFEDGNPAGGAAVAAFERSATAGSDGRFTLEGVPTARGPITVTATVGTADGTLRGRSPAVDPVPGGVIDVGTIVVSPVQAIGMVADDATRSVIVFDGETDSVLGTVSIGAGSILGDCSVTADLTLGFVTDFQSRVWAIDLAASPPRLASGTNPMPISNTGEDTSITPDGKFLVVCDGSNVQPVSVIDIATRAQVKTFDLGSDCNSVDVCSDGSVLVTSFNNGRVRRLRIDGEGNLTDTGEFLSASAPNNVFCSPGAQSGIVITRNADQIRSFTIPGLAAKDLRSLSGSFGISGVVHPAGDRVFTRDNGGAVDVFDYQSATGALGTSPRLTIPISNTPTYFGIDQMALNPEGTKLYVSQPGALNVYDASTGGLLTKIKSPSISSPTGVCFVRP